jgi:hypothetical protein
MFVRAMIGIVSMATLIAGTSAAPVVPRRADSDDAVLIARGKGYLVHEMCPHPEFVPFPGGSPGRPQMFLHTSTTTGRLSVLFSAGRSITVIPMGIDLVAYHRRWAAGVAEDGVRLYVVEGQASVSSKGGPVHAMPPADRFGMPTYRLLVFRLADGKKLHQIPFKEGDFPKEKVVFRDVGQPGPLRLRPRGVSCFGVTFIFEGDKLLHKEYKKK